MKDYLENPQLSQEDADELKKVQELAKQVDPQFSQPNSVADVSDLDNRIALQEAIKQQTVPPQSAIPEEIKNYVTKRAVASTAPKKTPSDGEGDGDKTPPPPPDKKPVQLDSVPELDVMEKLKRAQDLREQGQLASLFTNIRHNFEEASTPGFKADKTFVPALEKYMGQDVENIKETQTTESNDLKIQSDKIDFNDEKAKADPNSDVSLIYKNVLGKFLGPNIAAQAQNLNASQLEKLLPNLKSMAEKEGSDFAFERIVGPDGTVRLVAINKAKPSDIRDIGAAGYAYQSKINTRTGDFDIFNPSAGIFQSMLSPGTSQITQQSQAPVTDKEIPKSAQLYQTLNPNQRKAADTLQKQFSTESKDEMKALASVQGVLDFGVDLATKDPIARAQLGTRVARIFEKGVLTDDDVKRYIVRMGIADRVIDAFKDYESGTITKEKANLIKNTLREVSKELSSTLEKRALEKSKIFENKYGIPADEFKPFIFGGSDILRGVNKQPAKKTGNKQVVKKQYSKSRNQTKIMYSDGFEEILDGQQ